MDKAEIIIVFASVFMVDGNEEMPEFEQKVKGNEYKYSVDIKAEKST